MQQEKVLETRLKHYRLTRAGVTGVFVLFIGLSVLLQVLHAPKSGGWVAMLVGGFPPIAVFLCVEMIARIPMPKIVNAIARIVCAVGVAGMAIWLSYEQQYDYVAGLGFKGNAPALFPLIIDGVMFVATLSLVEVTRVIRGIREELAALSAPSVTPAPQPTPETVKPAEPVATHTKPQYAQSPGKPGRKHGPQQPSWKRKAPPASTPREGIKKRPEFRPVPPQEEPIEAVIIEKRPLSLPSATEDEGSVVSRP